MLAANFKRTKIVATIGPASWEPVMIEKLMAAGVNVLRLNFSHGTHKEHAAVVTAARIASKKLNKPVSIVADLQGPKLRVGTMPTEGLQLSMGSAVTLAYSDEPYQPGKPIPLQHNITLYTKTGQPIYLSDGKIELKVTGKRAGLIMAEVVKPGVLYTNHGVNLPEADLHGNILTSKDLADLKFILTQDVDYVALSFVQTAADIEQLRRKLSRVGSDLKIITKLEMRAAVENLPSIVAASDGVMVARGDLAVETKIEAVPVLQRRIIELCKHQQKFVIVATQMLDSMTNSSEPTRAEVSDVATAVMEGADAVMLSGETAVGRYPLETVGMMKRVIRYTEAFGLTEQRHDFGEPSTRSHAISAAAIVLARQMGAKVIVAETTSGKTALNLASFRPAVPIIMVTDTPRIYNQLAIIWGGKVFFVAKMKQGANSAIKQLLEDGYLSSGDSVVTVAGKKPGVTGGTNTVGLQILE